MLCVSIKRNMKCWSMSFQINISVLSLMDSHGDGKTMLYTIKITILI